MTDKKNPRRKVFKPEPNSALNVLQALLEKGNSPLAQDFKRYRLKLDWATVVGPMLSEKCSPVGFSNGIVYIWVVNSTWMNQLYFARRELLKKINMYATGAAGTGKVSPGSWAKEIRFTLDKKDVPKEAACLEGQPADRAPAFPNEGGEPPRDP